MKHILTTKTGDFCKVDTEFEGTAEEAVIESKRLIAFAETPGLSPDEWQPVLDDLLDDKSIKGDPGMIEQMNPAQRWLINEVKKSYKRLNK